MDLFDIAAKISLNTSDYEKDLAGAEKQGSAFGEKLKKGLGTAAKVGGAAVAAIGAGAVALGKKFVASAKETSQYGDEIDKMSQKLGLSKEAYQEWDYVLSQSGADITSISTGLKTLTNKLDDAKNGSEDAQKMFAALGLSMEDISSMSREDAFASVIAGFQGMADSTERAALANDLFGRSGQELTPLFNTTTDATNDLRQAAHDLGFVMSDEAVSAAADFNDALDTLQRTVGGLKKGFLSDFLPAITKVMDGLSLIFGKKEGGIEKIGEGISELVDKLSENVPKIVEVGFQIVEQLVMSINDNLPMLFEKAADIILNVIIPGILENLPALVETAFSIIAQLVTSIGQALPELIPAAVDVILQIVESLLDNIDLLIDAALALIMGLAEGLIKAIPKLIEKAPTIVIKLVEAIIRAVPKILSAAWELIKMLVKGIVDSFPKLLQAGRDLVLKIWEGLKEKINDAKTWGKDMIENFGKGISEKVQAVIQKVKDFAGKIKNLLGFSEPKEGPLSNFHTYAPDMMELFAKGIEDNKRKLQGTVADAFNFGGIITDPSGLGGRSPRLAAVGASGFGGTIDLYIDKDTLVGSTSREMDRDLGKMEKIKSRFGGSRR